MRKKQQPNNKKVKQSNQKDTKMTSRVEIDGKSPEKCIKYSQEEGKSPLIGVKHLQNTCKVAENDAKHLSADTKDHKQTSERITTSLN